MPSLEQPLRERIESLAQRWNVPGVVAGLDLAGETFFVCRGVTHASHPLPVDPDTLFQIASNSKPFTATLVLQLVAEGAVDLDDPVRKHLPEFGALDPRYADAVTVRHLLCHRVGLDGDALFVRQPDPPRLESVCAALARARPLVPPGGHWTYCNAGFSVAGRLVETLRGQPFDAVLRERILAPLGMGRSCTRADEAIFHRVAMRHFAVPGHDPIPLHSGGWQRGWELAPVDTPAGGCCRALPISCVGCASGSGATTRKRMRRSTPRRERSPSRTRSRPGIHSRGMRSAGLCAAIRRRAS